MESPELGMELAPRAELSAAGAWDAVSLDDLHEPLLQKAVEFLQGFTPPHAEMPLWSVEYFKWKLGDSNPAGKGFLTCALAQGRVVGTVSVVLKRLWYNRHGVIGAEIGDTYTHPDFLKRPKERDAARPMSWPAASLDETSRDMRKSNIFSRLANDTRARALDAGIRTIYGTPNALARPGWVKRLQFKIHPTHDNRTFIRPTMAGLVRTRARLRPLSPLLALGEGAFEGMTFARWELQRMRGGYAIETMYRPTDELDALWHRLKDQHLFSLVRDRRYLQHRFFDHPLAHYVVYRASRGRQIQGVMVIRVLTMPWGKRYCSIADWFLDERQPHLFSLLLAHAVHQHRHAPIDGFYLWCGPHPAFRHALRWLGFVRAAPSPIIFYDSEEGRQFLEQCHDLDFTLASSDNI